ncbi:MAG: LysR family transcriptional regulator [Ideonella sp.]|nr:LysR family transcriptional regulator [Ideonella sp.]MCC7457609.1 LysR family transcriptional regulator [Nitrospira sp.]
MSGKTDQLNGPAAQRLRINLRQLEVFAATARAGTVRAAADQVSRSQSAASATLVELEGTLGVQLFDRVGRRLLLNENGRALLPKAMSLLDRAAELQGLFAAEHDAPLRLAASLTIGEYLLPDLLANWTSTHPASPVQLMIGNTSEVIAAVAGFDVDIGFIEGRQTHPQLVVHAWRSDELVVIAAPGHPLASGPASLRQLSDATWALREHGSGTREAVERWLLEHVGALRVALELGSPEAIKRLVAAGSALGCLPREVVAHELEQGMLIELATRLPRATRRLSIVRHRDKHLGRGAEDFLRHCASSTGMPAGSGKPRATARR